jgi:ABC-type lipoprotein release transport system permease subunit
LGLASDDIYWRLALMFVIVCLMSTQSSIVQGQTTAVLTGSVLNEENEPIQDAIVLALGPRYMLYQVKTDSSGRFQLVMDQEGWYSVYAMCDRPETLGTDYVPSLWTSYLQGGSTSTFTFILKKGASINLEGEIRFVESSKPASNYRFTVTDPNGEPLDETSSVYTYGSDTDLARRFGYAGEMIVVPADTEVAIRVEAYISSPPVSHTFVIKGKAGYFRLAQGEALRVPSMEYMMDFNVVMMKNMWDSTFYLLREVERMGFLVSAERNDMQNAYGMIDSSLLAMKKKLYEEAFADLRNAYVLTRGSIETLQGLIQISSLSALLLLPIFAFIASSSAYLMAEKDSCIELYSHANKRFSTSVNLLISIVLYVVLAFTFYFAYPGCRLINQTVLFSVAITMLILGQLAVAAFPRIFSEKKSEGRSIRFGSALMIAFSMGCRNLRRRKMRTIMSLANVMILVFAFITLTSISPRFGLVTQPLQPSIRQNAILIKDKLMGSPDPFIPLPSSFLSWLESQPNVTLIAPKAENIPDGDLGELYTKDGKTFIVRGILGVIPSVEANFTGLDKVIIEGDYLRDDDLGGVLICSKHSESLGVSVGDKLYGFGREFTIRGFFEKAAMDTLKDVDGSLLNPHVIVPGGNIIHCSAEEMIIVNYNMSFSLPRVVISRANIRLGEPDEQKYSEFALMVALSREYQVYVSKPDSLYLQYLGGYTEEKGTVMIPFLMILVMLNISSMMFGSVSERRNEIATLSSVGLNPTHISALFIAEAVVIGFIGGGLGYLMGILGYRTALTSLLGALLVREKASAEWGLMALLFSVSTAVIASLIPAQKASTIATPSLLRKWSIADEVRPRETGQPWVLNIPAKLTLRELEPFMGFILKRLREGDLSGHKVAHIMDIRLEDAETERGPLKKVKFRYVEQLEEKSTNELIVQKPEGEEFFEAKLFCKPSRESLDAIRNTATYMRSLIFEWNAMKFEVASAYDPSMSQLYTLLSAYNPTTIYLVTTRPGVDEELEDFKKALVLRGLRPPRMVISRVDLFDIENLMKAAEEIVSRANVVCISGEPAAVCTALAMYASKQRKLMCYVIDPRAPEERLTHPYEDLKIINVT